MNAAGHGRTKLCEGVGKILGVLSKVLLSGEKKGGKSKGKDEEDDIGYWGARVDLKNC